MPTPAQSQNDDMILSRFYQVTGHFFDDVSVAIYACENPDGIVSYYNKHAAKLWGCHPVLRDPSVRFCGSLKMIRIDGTVLPHHECPMAEVLRTGIPVHDQEVIVECPDGSRHTVLVNIAPILSEDQAILGAVNIFVDITDRKHAQAALSATNELLEQHVQQRADELFKANMELREKVEDLEQFHDLAVTRELKMIQLETEIAKLQKEIEVLRDMPSNPSH